MEKRSFYLQLVCIIILLSFVIFSSESADHVTANHSKTPKLKEKSTMQQKYLGESKTKAIGSGSRPGGPNDPGGPGGPNSPGGPGSGHNLKP